MSTPEQRIAAFMLSHLGAPYIWGGKGYVKWSPTGLVSHGFETSPGSGHPLWVSDCAGAITSAIHDLGGPDWRGTHTARMLRDECSEREVPPNQFGTLHFYGPSRDRIVHVAFSLDNGLVIEAAGGDQTTTVPVPGKCMRVGFEQRRDFQEAGRLPLLSLLK